MFTRANVAATDDCDQGAILNVKQAMAQRRLRRRQVQDPRADLLGAAADGVGLPLRRDRLHAPDVGGCGVWNSDANWATHTVVPTINSTVQQRGRERADQRPGARHGGALDGRRLCENTVGLLEEKGVATWTSRRRGRQDRVGQQIRTVTTIFPPYQLQEDAHPNYWGQLALRNCFRQAYNGGAARGGTCTRGTGLNGSGEPKMTLS